MMMEKCGWIYCVFLLATVSAYTNIAPSGQASQTDDEEPFSTADKAIDGNTDGIWRIGAGNSVAMTQSSGASWEVRFNSPKYIDRIVVWNRADYKTERIDGVKVSVGGDVVATLAWDCPRQTQFAVNNVDKTARVVKLKAPEGSPISIAEVEVFGADTKQDEPDEPIPELDWCAVFPRTRIITNIANRGVATQIDDYNIYTTADKAIDGNTYPYYSGNSANTVQLTKSAIPGRTWWKLTFPKEVYIDRIVVYNRLQGNQNRMEGQKVELDGEEVGRFKYTTVNQKAYPMDIKKSGQVLKMIAREGGDGYIQMAEVEVFGEVTPEE